MNQTADAGRFDDPDIELMLRFQAGDERAFEELVLKHQKRILNVVYRALGDRAQAEDAAQDIFLKVYRARRSYRPQAKFSTWLYRIAVNHCLNEVRARRPGPIPMDDLLQEPVAHSPDDQMNQTDLQRAVKEAIDALPENQRVAVILARFEDLSYEEIGEAMGLSLEAVKSVLFRAKENLKQRLGRFISR
ncbi:MAG: sigma-70 family RNA polymerase sigma factor [Planctomycetes bacterium]|nr:sigma-70 family RNA polymerase sigma factor [Planctomycetota bacterium]